MYEALLADVVGPGTTDYTFEHECYNVSGSQTLYYCRQCVTTYLVRVRARVRVRLGLTKQAVWPRARCGA